MNLEFNKLLKCLYACGEFQLGTIRPFGAVWHSFYSAERFAEVAPSVSQGACGSCSSKLVCPHKHIPIFCFTELVVPNNPNTII